MCAKHYENPTMLSRVTAKNVGDVFFEAHCSCRLPRNICYEEVTRNWSQSNLAFMTYFCWRSSCFRCQFRGFLMAQNCL